MCQQFLTQIYTCVKLSPPYFVILISNKRQEVQLGRQNYIFASQLYTAYNS